MEKMLKVIQLKNLVNLIELDIKEKRRSISNGFYTPFTLLIRYRSRIESMEKAKIRIKKSIAILITEILVEHCEANVWVIDDVSEVVKRKLIN